jgi:hypothetical protein
MAWSSQQCVYFPAGIVEQNNCLAPALVRDPLCGKLVELVDLGMAHAEKKSSLLAGIMKNSAEKIYGPFGPREHLCLAKTPSGVSYRQTPPVLTVKSRPHSQGDNILARHSCQLLARLEKLLVRLLLKIRVIRWTPKVVMSRGQSR